MPSNQLNTKLMPHSIIHGNVCFPTSTKSGTSPSDILVVMAVPLSAQCGTGERLGPKTPPLGSGSYPSLLRHVREAVRVAIKRFKSLSVQEEAIVATDADADPAPVHFFHGLDAHFDARTFSAIANFDSTLDQTPSFSSAALA
jgi:hypothetical protein